MGCCNQKRTSLRLAGAAARSVSTGASAPAAGESAAASRGRGRGVEVPLRYLGARAVRVRGAASGRVYVVRAQAAELLVDQRDVAGLLRTRQFARR